MKSLSAPARSIALAVAVSAMLAGAAQAEDTAIETAALRCSAISIVHSPLTVPTPQFGELMTQFAGFFAQVHVMHKEQRTKSKINLKDVAAQRDVIITELGKGWPGVKNDRVKEAAICNTWRNTLFAKLSDKSTEKDFQAEVMKMGEPPTTVAKDELDRWASLTPQAFAMWSQIKVNQKGKK